MRILFILFIVTSSVFSWAKISLPKNLSSTDRRVALETLGLTSATKLLSDPYPLGGYSGVEVGLTSEVISTSELSRLGDKTQRQEEVSYSVVTLGKGIFNNLDLFVHFSPFQNSDDLTNYGGLVRWGFFQAEYLPAYMSFVAYANTVSYQNLINTTTQGYDVVVGFSVEDVTLYSGAGVVRSSGIFIGGADGVVASDDGAACSNVSMNCETKQESVSQPHYMVGLTLKFSRAFLAFELDRYAQAAYSAKLGYRF